MRVVSLLPSATEIVCALGFEDALVGISHECDFPAHITDRPRVTRCEIHGADLSSAAIDGWVRDTLAGRGTLYTLDEPVVQALRPDVVITQQLCDVCAVSYGSVAAFAAALPSRPRVLNLQPGTLQDILADIQLVADALGAPQRGRDLTARLQARIDAVARAVALAAPRATCFLLEWIEPPYCGGHWNPQLVALAGGTDPIGRVGQPSRRLDWDEVARADPDVIVLACCGFSVERTLQEAAAASSVPQWQDLRAVREGNVFVVDANAYFSRPGPRIADSLEMLAHILHPGLVARPAAGQVVRLNRARAAAAAG
jgi:iron complex transport system substrate-binding protein